MGRPTNRVACMRYKYSEVNLGNVKQQTLPTVCFRSKLFLLQTTIFLPAVLHLHPLIFSMVLILPFEDNGLAALEENINAEILLKAVKETRSMKVEVTLPKFKVKLPATRCMFGRKRCLRFQSFLPLLCVLSLFPQLLDRGVDRPDGKIGIDGNRRLVCRQC